MSFFFFFFQAEDGIRDLTVTGVQTCALPICLHVRMRRRAGGSGRLFGSVGPADIAAAVREAGGPELDRRRIELRDPIKTVGTHQVRVRLHSEVSAPVDIEITAS